MKSVPGNEINARRPRVQWGVGEKDDVMLHAVSCDYIPEQPKVESIDSRHIQIEELSLTVHRSSEINLMQKMQFFEGLNEELCSFTTRTCKCHFWKCKFYIKTDHLSRSFSRPVPFALKQADKAEGRKNKSRRVKFKRKPQIWLKAYSRSKDKTERKKNNSRRGKFKWKTQIKLKANHRWKNKVRRREHRRRVKFKWKTHIRGLVLVGSQRKLGHSEYWCKNWQVKLRKVRE
jgi:hypothetical protein